VGTARAISFNTAGDIKPSDWPCTNWNYALFDSFGGGAFVPNYSPLGGYVIAGTGGHGHPDYIHAVVFDFSTGRWEQLLAANAVNDKRGAVYNVADTAGAPGYEIQGSVVPAPAHPYQNLCFMPDGAKGSVVYVTRSAIASESVNSGHAHRFDLATRTWSRLTQEALQIGRAGADSSAVWDEARNRWWLVSSGYLHIFENQVYLDRADMAWRYTGKFAWPSGTGISNSSRVMMHGGMLLRNSGPSGGLRLFDPDNASAGWINLDVNGALPRGGDAWARYSDGRWYAYDGLPGAGNTIARITPPADLKTGTWVVDAIAVGGDLLPTKSGLADPAQTSHYTRFFYVPALDRLCWIPGPNKAVYTIKLG
jgi:hypothetical protein